MNDQNLSLTPDDLRLTAFALGELEGDERALVAAAVAADPALQAIVDEIRATAAQLESALAAEPVPAEPTFSARRAAIIAGSDPRRHDGGPLASWGRVIPFRRYTYVAGTLAAACLAVAIGLRQSPPGARPGLAANEPVRKKAAVEARQELSESERKQREMDLARQAKDQAAVSTPLDPRAGPAADRAAAESVVVPSAPASTVPSNPFEIASSADRGFQSGSVGTSASMKVDLMDTPVSYSIVNREFIDALGVADMREAAAWSTNQTWLVTDNGAMSNNGAQQYVQQRQAASGAAAAGSTESQRRSFEKEGSSNDSYSVTGFDFGRGANGSLFGAAGAATTGLSGVTSVQTSRARAPDGSGRGGGQPYPPAAPQANTESYGFRRNHAFVPVGSSPLSTFSIDVDTAAYANVRRFLQNGQLPPVDAVRVEEMVNYFPYRYAPPQDPVEGGNWLNGRPPADAAPFAASLEVANAPWDPALRLVRVGLKGREISAAARPRANLVFLLDVSGSMAQPNKLPLVKESMRLLLRRLREDDRVAIVVYAGASGVALPSTAAANAGAIEAAIERLAASGSTNGAEGINLAYQIANEHFIRGGINRVILCTDGDFNVGVTNQGDLVRMVEERAKSNVFLTVLGFGMGNLKDSTLELLADKGNGNYGYIDTRAEAEKLLVDQVHGTLVTIAKDVKIQVEFNPAQVASYRLVGYENRLLAREDFNNDQIDAGEIGAGHTVTALYEIVPVGGAGNVFAAGAPTVDELRYQPAVNAAAARPTSPSGEVAAELLTVKIRYKEPTGDVSRKLEFPLRDRGAAFREASPDFKFAAAVAGFGLALREPNPNTRIMQSTVEWAEAGLRDDPMGYRLEFIGLVRRAIGLVENGVSR